MTIDNDLEVIGLEEETKLKHNSSDISELESYEMKNEIKISDALQAIRIVEKYYFKGNSKDYIYTNLLNIENDLRDEFLKKKTIQRKISEYFIQK